jgi:hypothetical protein
MLGTYREEVHCYEMLADKSCANFSGLEINADISGPRNFTMLLYLITTLLGAHVLTGKKSTGNSARTRYNLLDRDSVTSGNPCSAVSRHVKQLRRGTSFAHNFPEL